MKTYNCDIIEEKYPEHSIYISSYEEPDDYDAEIIIDDVHTGYWIFEEDWFGSDEHGLNFICEIIDNYLKDN